MHIELLAKEVPRLCLYLLIVYPSTDWLLCIVSAVFLAPLIREKNKLIKETEGGLDEDDFSQVLYLPVEYESDDDGDDN